MRELAERLEVLIKGDDVAVGAIWDPGDFKDSARNADHGRWLLCDGRSLTQAQVESALGLTAGEAAEFATVMGTGTASLYGDTAAGQIQIPDFRAFFLRYQSATVPKKGAGSTGGAATVALAEANLPSHSHAAGTLQSAAHSHGHSFSVNTDGAHSHSVSDPGHQHYTLYDGGGNPLYLGFGYGWNTYSSSLYIFGNSDMAAFGFSTNFWVGGAYTGVSVNTGGSHSHGLSGSVSSAGPHTVSGTTSATGSGTAHENLPPFKVKGNCFIRV